ncbi:MAG: hypothetical protein M5U10_09690 [Candidatus Methanoperedens sp.]|nr:hypothetical protein [Candidatus Methanoperedens nitroreducens]MDJ1422173.1 hypothetical protein [Candidatus Methanoperedens sp.]
MRPPEARLGAFICGSFFAEAPDIDCSAFIKNPKRYYSPPSSASFLPKPGAFLGERPGWHLLAGSELVRYLIAFTENMPKVQE